jgi:integrase/recombinase XerC/integrase/recombinase XerD
MVNHLLIDAATYAQSLASLHLLTSQNTLQSQITGFLVTCQVEDLSPHTLRYYKYQLGLMERCFREMGVASAAEATTAHVRLAILRVQEKNKPSSVHSFYRAVCRFFNWLVEEEVLEKSPAARVRPPRVPEVIIVPFRPEQVRDMLTVNPPTDLVLARNRAIILVFLDTGLRVSEMTGIQLADVDIDRATIKVMGKGSRERIVAIGKHAQMALLKYVMMRHDTQPCLWVNRYSRPMTKWGISQMIADTGRRAEVTGVRCSSHTFRHTSGTMAMRNGASEREVQLLLGHKTRKMTQHYTATLTSEFAVKSHCHFSPVDNLLK